MKDITNWLRTITAEQQTHGGLTEDSLIYYTLGTARNQQFYGILQAIFGMLLNRINRSDIIKA